MLLLRPRQRRAATVVLLQRRQLPTGWSCREAGSSRRGLTGRHSSWRPSASKPTPSVTEAGISATAKEGELEVNASHRSCLSARNIHSLARYSCPPPLHLYLSSTSHVLYPLPRLVLFFSFTTDAAREHKTPAFPLQGTRTPPDN